MMPIRAILLLSFLVTLVPGEAWAQPTSGEDEAPSARQLFQQGAALAQEERWGEAYEFFRRSWELANQPVVAFNMAAVLVRLGRAVEARQYIRLFMASDPSEADRASAEVILRHAQETMSTLALTISPAEAVLEVDGSEPTYADGGAQGRQRTILLDPGSHQVVARAPDHATIRITVEALPGQALPSRSLELSSTAPTEGSLVVTTEVEDAIIRIDGEIAGRGSVSRTMLPGEHRVQVTADGYETVERSVTIVAGQRMRLDATLESTRGLLESPLFWGAVGIALVGGGIAAGVLLSGEEDPYGGTAGFTLQALRR